MSLLIKSYEKNIIVHLHSIILIYNTYLNITFLLMVKFVFCNKYASIYILLCINFKKGTHYPCNLQNKHHINNIFAISV